MGLIFLILFLGLPIAEIWAIGRVGSILGFWDTAFLLIFSAVFGVYMAKIQGKAVLLKVQQCLAEGRVPTVEMIDGLLVFLGGILFVIPGFITDAFGFLLIFPPTRWLIRWWISISVVSGVFSNMTKGRHASAFRAGAEGPESLSRREVVRPVPGSPRPRGPIQDAEIVDH